MEEIIKIKLAATQLALTKESYALLAHYLDNIAKAYASDPNKESLVEQTEAKIASLLLAAQSPAEVVERGTMERAIAQVGYPEGFTPTGSPNDIPIPHTTPSTRSAKPEVGPLGRVVIICAKVLLGIFLAGWVLTAIGLLVTFVTTMALGDVWAAQIPFEGISPIVFVGLVCAVVVLFMGIVADLMFRLIAGKQVNLRKLAVAGVVWLIFLLWLIFASVRSADDWVEWSYQSKAKLEQWEENLESWADSFEDSVEQFAEGAVIDERHITFELNGLLDAVKLGMLCEEFDELYRYDDMVARQLIKGKDVTIDVTLALEGDSIVRTTTITTPHTVDSVTVTLDRTTGALLHYEITQ